MKQASSRELFGYWTGLRGRRTAPERGEIEPSAIRRILGDVFIVEIARNAGHPFRIAGTRACALFGCELKNQPFLDLWDEKSRTSVADLVAVVADELTGVVASANGNTPQGWTQDIELLLLPLAHRGDTRARMIGVLAPVTAPFWLGSSTLGALSLGTIRHLNPTADTPIAARLAATAQVPGRLGVFTVYEGGRS